MFQLPMTSYDHKKSEVLVHWRYIWKAVIPTLEASSSIVLGLLSSRPCSLGTSFDNQLTWIGTVRRIEPHKIINKKTVKLMMWWLRDLANRQSFQLGVARIPVVLARSEIPTGGWHALTPEREGEPPLPSCKWRQVPGTKKVFFASRMVTAESAERRWCRQCLENFPASFQAVLYNSAIELLK